MSMRGGIWAGWGKHPNGERIAQALQNYLGLELVPPATDVRTILDVMTLRELSQFDNLRSVEGMQELFRARSIRATVDPAAHRVTLTIAPAAELERELKAEHTRGQVLHVELSHPTAHIIRPPETDARLTDPVAIEPTAPVPPEYEHLEGLEQLRRDLVDLFVKHGQLTVADKDVLKKLVAVDGSVEARVTALERWQTEMGRRLRGLLLPRLTAVLTLAGNADRQPDPAQALFHRYDTILHWVAKLIKAFEASGLRYHNKPMWLPH